MFVRPLRLYLVVYPVPAHVGVCYSFYFLSVTHAVAQIAYLNAMHYGANYLFFSGNFVRENRIFWERLTSAIEFCTSRASSYAYYSFCFSLFFSHDLLEGSQGRMQAMFLQHDGYLGALGSLLSISASSETSHV